MIVARWDGSGQAAILFESPSISYGPRPNSKLLAQHMQVAAEKDHCAKRGSRISVGIGIAEIAEADDISGAAAFELLGFRQRDQRELQLAVRLHRTAHANFHNAVLACLSQHA